jgi:hypothetical protein
VRIADGWKYNYLNQRENELRLRELKPFTCVPTYLHGTPEFWKKLKLLPVLTK